MLSMLIRWISAPNYKKWDTVQEFRIWDAAYLWNDIEPPPLRFRKERATEEVFRKQEEITHAMATGAFPNAYALKRPNGKKSVANVIPREDLRKWAEDIGERPRFLFH